MTTQNFFKQVISRFSKLLLVSFALGLGTLFAQRADEQVYYLSDDVVEELGKLDKLQGEKKWDEMVALLDKLYQKAKPASYDKAMLSQYKGKVFLMKNDLRSAMPPLVEALALSDNQEKKLKQKRFFKTEAEQELRYYIAQIAYQEAIQKGVSSEDQKNHCRTAERYMQEWHSLNVKANLDATLFYASILYNLAQISGESPSKPDLVYLEKAQAVVKKGLTESVKVRENLLLIQISILQQQERFAEAAEYLEQLVKVQPNNKNHWQQLFASYYQLGQDTDPKKAEQSFDYNIRSVVTLDRAQALGHMNTPKDNFNRVGIYFNLQQHEVAAEYLWKGLRDGSIEDTLKNWEILSFSYQQINKEDKAIEVLKEALKRYPDRGQLWFTVAQNYYGMDQSKQAMAATLKALEVGNLEKPFQVYSFLAYMAFDLREFDQALEASKKALSYADSKKDTQLPKLKQAIEEAIKEREMNKRAIEAQHKNL